MAGSMGHFEYQSDNGTVYQTRLDVSNAATVGGVVAVTSLPDLPKHTHPRYLLARHPTSGRERKITCPDPTNTLWTGNAGAVISLIDYNTNAATNYIVAGRIGERRFAP
jgi:hypothetical protein